MNRRTLKMDSLRQGLAALGVGALCCAAAYASDTVNVESDLSPMLSKSVVTSHADQNKLINVVLVLKMKDAEGATNYAQHVSTRLHPLYGHYLTPEQFGDKFGPSKADYTALVAWAKGNGLKINEESRSRTTLSVRGTMGQLERLFKTQFNNYRAPDGREFFSASIALSAPQEFSGRVESVIGLSSYNRFAPLAQVYRKLSEAPSANGVSTDTAGGTGPGGAYSPADLRAAYNIPTNLSIPSKTETVAVFEQGGFFQSDVDVFLKQNHLPSVPVTVRGVNGFGGGVNDPGVELEAVLDIDAAIGFNWALKQVQVYEDGDDPFSVALIDALAAMANDQTAQIISISYGLDEVQQGAAQVKAEGPLFQQLAAQGQTVFVSSGDQGAYGRTGGFTSPVTYNAPDPGSQPFITSVGGTSLYTGPNEAYGSEEVWNNLGAGFGATGGGVSSIWKIPSWQLNSGGVSVAKANGGSSKMRNVPDVAAVASPLTGFAVYSAINGGWIQIGGTSLSSPLWAGYASILDSTQRALGLGQMGFFNPTLYSLAQSTNGLYDTADGSNGNANLFGGKPGYSAGFGYDNCTGWGSMFGPLFLYRYLANPSTTGTVPAMPRGLNAAATRTTVTVDWTAVPTANGYIAIIGSSSFFGVVPVTDDVTRGTKAVLRGLTPNTTYAILLAALNQAGSSSFNQVFITTAK
jgi:subtilase family serine protease